MSKELRRSVIKLASKMALEETKTGKDYSKAISGSLEKACRTIGITNKSFINMFEK